MTPLRQRMTEDMQVRNLSPHTQTSYLQQVSLFARHFNKSPEQLGPEDIRAYQVYLTNERKLSPSSILIAVSALRFLYKVSLKKDWTFDEIIPAPKKPQKLPVVLSPEEVLHFLQCVGSTKHRAILTTCYAAGLRISESVHLKPTDVDSQRMVIRVEQGKGQKDRYVMLSPKLLETLRYYWRAVRPKGWLFEGDIPGINDAGTHPGGRLGSVREVPRRTHLQAAWNERHVLLSAAREVRPHHVRVRSAKREADASGH